jgi:hypothetical protein
VEELQILDPRSTHHVDDHHLPDVNGKQDHAGDNKNDSIAEQECHHNPGKME